jgi:hypothetical protein
MKNKNPLETIQALYDAECEKNIFLRSRLQIISDVALDGSAPDYPAAVDKLASIKATADAALKG